MEKRANSRIVAASLLLVAGAASGQPGSATSKASVDLVSSVEAVAQGQPFDVALRFQLTEGWHIYWQNSGDSGRPPKVEWALPEGFTAGDPQFPIPKRHYAAGGITTNILKHDPVLLVRITPPDVIAAGPVTLEAKVHYLICKELCVLEQPSVKLDLPVVAPGGTTKPANKEVFDRARAAMPKLTSKYVTITPTLSATQLSPGQEFELQLTIDVAKRHHIQSHTPTMPGFIKCDVFMAPTGGLNFEDVVYPKPHLREVQYLGKLSEYSGRVVVRVPGKVAEDPPPGPVSIGGVFTYQACNDKGTCFPPDAIAFSLAGAATIEAGASAARETGGALAGETGSTVDEALADAPELPGFLARFGLFGLLAACFLYGLVLNATPCVFPLLSIKIMGFVQQAHESRRRTLALGVVFGVGVMLFFVVLGFLAASGKNVLQYPVAVIALGTVVLALALSMLDVYTLQPPSAATKLEASIQKEGLLSSFGKGALAPVLGFACTGPFLAGAFAWATQQPPRIAIFAFLAAGLGMASPYVVLGANPNWLSFLPRPGNWMITFERIMGFLLLAMVIWLLHPLTYHIGAEGLEWTLGFMVAVALACWVLGKVDLRMSAGKRWQYRGGAGAIAGIAGVVVFVFIYPLDEAQARQIAIRNSVPSHEGKQSSGPADEIPWRTWSAKAVEAEVRSGRTVFVDFTSAYCTSCKQNKVAAINRPEARAKMKELGVVPFQADFTGGDPDIFAALKKHGLIAVPLNLIYPAGKPDQPIVLETVFTLSYLLRKFDEAGPSTAE